MYSGPKLIELLGKQHQIRQSDLFAEGTFILQWRAKVGSFPHPDLETLVSAGEPCGVWKPTATRPEAKRNVGDNWQQLCTLPLNGYIPGSSIRGLVRAWAKKRPEIKSRMYQLLGYQEQDTIKSGKIEFLDAWPDKASKLALDIVNPQQDFQVYHQGQSTPLSSYTLGNGQAPIAVTVAIRGIVGRTTVAEVDEVWDWVQQALSSYGIGSRTASGYGTLKPPQTFRPDGEARTADPGYTTKHFEFSLYGQGNAGPNTQTMELRPSHWRGWLRSWVLRFLLGVMTQENAKKTLGELLGILEPKSCKGCVRLQMLPGQNTWSEGSYNSPKFYAWEGKLQISAPTDTLNKIILPIIKFAVMVGGVGRGWRRPLHIFHMNNNGRAATRGTHLVLTHKVKNKNTFLVESKPYGLTPDVTTWTKTYEDWLTAVKSQWPSRIQFQNKLEAEVFSPSTCAVYLVPGPNEEPIDYRGLKWIETDGEETRGDGIYLIYQEQPPRNYKRNRDLGGNAASGNAYCSWASIKRVNIPNKQEDTRCQEIVCLFMGIQTPSANHVRSRFLKDLSDCSGAVSLFGVQPTGKIQTLS